jgi:hypothetical protein
MATEGPFARKPQTRNSREGYIFQPGFLSEWIILSHVHHDNCCNYGLDQSHGI